MKTILILSIIWSISFILWIRRKASNTHRQKQFLFVMVLILPFIILSLLAIAHKVSSTPAVVYVTFLLVALSMRPLKKIAATFPHKYWILFFYFLILSLSIGIIQFSLEWGIQNPFVSATNTWDYWLNWSQSSGWNKTQTNSILIKNLISGFVISGLSFFFYTSPNLIRKKRQLEETRLNEKITQLELETLYAKINPEFLHHSLQTIAGTALSDGETTREMSLRLSRYFRYCINKEERNLVTPAEEIEMTRIFLEFEQQYYTGKLEWQIGIPNEIGPELIPRLLLQSLADYCIRQAHQNQIARLRLSIEFQSLAEGLMLLIYSQDLLLTDKDLHSPLLRRIRQKLDLTLADAYVLNIHSQPTSEIVILLKKHRYI